MFFMLAPWGAVILLCLCVQLTTTAQSLSVILEVGLLCAQLYPGVHIEGTAKKCVLHIRPRSARAGDYWQPENPSLN